MTNLYLQQAAAPVAGSERMGDLLSAVILALSAVLALVTFVTV